MKAPKTSSSRIMSLALLGSLVACGDEGQGEDPPWMITATEGTTDTDGVDDGADETGGGPTVANGCLMDTIPGRFGYKYQCAGSITIDISIEGDFDGSPVLESLTLDFGAGVEGDSYDAPHVMACCEEYDPGAPNCGQEHEQYCMADLVEQGCKSMDPKLEDFADEEFGGPGIENAAKHAAVMKIAEHVRDHRLDCNNAFAVSTGITTTPPTCDEEDNGVAYDSLLESGAWSFDPDGLLIDNVTISVGLANWAGLSPLDETPDECMSADENDGVLFLELDPDPGAMVGVLAMGSASIEGPWIEGEPINGVGGLESEATSCTPDRCSSMAVLVDPTAGLGSLENLAIYSAGSAVVGTPETEFLVDDFAVRLWDSALGVHDARTGTLSFAPGAVRLVVSASSMGSSYAVTATNESELVLTAQGQGWAASVLTIGYDDHRGDHWTLAIEPTQWH